MKSKKEIESRREKETKKYYEIEYPSSKNKGNRKANGFWSGVHYGWSNALEWVLRK